MLMLFKTDVFVFQLFADFGFVDRFGVEISESFGSCVCHLFIDMNILSRFLVNLEMPCFL